MTDTTRIYTIPARDVVPGMLVAYATDAEGSALLDMIRDVEQYYDGVAYSLVGSPRGYRHVLTAESIEVTLPGPSPRDKDARGGVCTCPDTVLGADGRYHVPTGRSADDWRLLGADDLHDVGCHVRMLRLRLWPVGATWFSVDDDAGWCVPLPRHPVPQNIRAFHLDSMLSRSSANYDGMRAAFCERWRARE